MNLIKVGDHWYHWTTIWKFAVTSEHFRAMLLGTETGENCEPWYGD